MEVNSSGYFNTEENLVLMYTTQAEYLGVLQLQRVIMFLFRSSDAISSCLITSKIAISKCGQKVVFTCVIKNNTLSEVLAGVIIELILFF